MNLTEQATGIQHTLSNANFVAQGGQGSVYVKGGLAFKIYTSPADMMPLGKIQELSALDKPNIIKPLNVLLDKKGVAVGYTMKSLQNTWTLCQLFPKAFRDREGLTNKQIEHLVKDLRDTVAHIHSKNILIVDLNEMNFMVEKYFKETYCIDTDSYQTPSFPATVIMDSIRDRHMTGHNFNEGTDWFAFAVLSFQLFVGVHPYRGKHPSIKNLDDRMKANISVFDSKVDLPSIVLPFDVIPDAWLAWYKEVFEKGARVAPPDTMITAAFIAAVMKPQIIGQAINMELILTTANNIIWHFNNRSWDGKSFYIGNRAISAHPGYNQLGTTRLGKNILAGINYGKIELFCLEQQAFLDVNISASQIMSYDGTVYYQNQDKLFRLDFIEMANKVLVSSAQVGNVMPSATLLFTGGAIQNMLGATYFSALPSKDMCYQVRLAELDGQYILNATFKSGVLGVVTEYKGDYYRHILRFNENYSQYDIRTTKLDMIEEINFAVLDSGVVVLINEDDEIEIFSSHKDSTNLKIIKDPAIDRSFRLFKNGTMLMAVKDNKLYKLGMK